MAHMQMEVEKHPKKKSPIAEIVSVHHQIAIILELAHIFIVLLELQTKEEP